MVFYDINQILIFNSNWIERQGLVYNFIGKIVNNNLIGITNILKIFKIEYKNLTENDKLNIIHNIIKNKQELNTLKKHIKNNF